MTLESLKWIDKHLIFRETFNSEADTIKNVWPITWTGVTFSDGRIYKTSNTSWINMNQINMPDKWSIRFIFSTSTVATYRCLIGNVNLSAPTATRLQHNASGGLDMRNNVNASAKTANGVIDANTEYDVIVTNDGTATGNITFYINWVKSGSSKTLADSFQFTRLLWAGAGYGFTGNCNLAELYSRALSAEEVSALYDNSLYREPSLKKNIVLDINPQTGSFNDKVSDLSPTNTDVELVNDGGTFVWNYNGTSSILEFSSRSIGTVHSMSIWFKMVNFNGSRIITSSNANNYVYFLTENTIRYRCNNETNKTFSPAKTISSNEWHNMVITRDDLSLKLYIDGVESGTLTLDDNGAFTFSNIGGTASVFCFGNIGRTIIYDKVLTAKEIARIYNSQKQYYNL